MIIDDCGNEYMNRMCMYSIINQFGRLLYTFKESDENIMNLNGDYEIQLTIEVVTESIHNPIYWYDQLSMNKVCVIVSRKKWNWIIHCHSINSPSILFRFSPYQQA